MSRVEIFQGRARRRWSDEDKRRLVAETFVPGETVHAVGRRHGVNTSQLFTWRKRFRAAFGLPAPAPPPAPPASAVPAFAAVALAPADPSPEASGGAVSEASGVMPSGVIEIELPHGGRVRISGPVDPAAVTAALRVLTRRWSPCRTGRGCGWRPAIPTCGAA